jgi:rhodanese-related sulfurtransferase
MNVPTISPQKLHERMAAGENVDLIDVRTPVEFREVHAEGARNLPLDSLHPADVTKQRNGSADQPLFVICRSGNRASKACEKLVAAGFANVVNVEGGTQAWDEAGLPVNRGKKAISLERQVRIAAGFLVLVGAVLALTVHPYFAALSGIIGAGLMFAGITDTCGMAMILARMPWNQVKSSKAIAKDEKGKENNSPACCSQ